MRRLSQTFLFCFLVVASVMFVVPKAAIALDAADLPAAIANAKTAADHEAIAAYYDGQAKAANAEAERHQALAGDYAKLVKTPAGKGVPSGAYKAMPSHCKDLAKDYKASAKQYEAMAALHRKAASAIK
jgi:hypothetical protein